MKLAIFLLAVTLAAQTPATMHECGLGKDKAHPCHCVEHTSKVQVDWIDECKRSGKPETKCWQEMPVEVRDHCAVIEHYGNWHQNEAGQHDSPMPMQCTSACLRSHCFCQDGPTCHIMHEPEEQPKPRSQKH